MTPNEAQLALATIFLLAKTSHLEARVELLETVMTRQTDVMIAISEGLTKLVTPRGAVVDVEV